MSKNEIKQYMELIESIQALSEASQDFSELFVNSVVSDIKEYENVRIDYEGDNDYGDNDYGDMATLLSGGYKWETENDFRDLLKKFYRDSERMLKIALGKKELTKDDIYAFSDIVSLGLHHGGTSSDFENETEQRLPDSDEDVMTDIGELFEDYFKEFQMVASEFDDKFITFSIQGNLY